MSVVMALARAFTFAGPAYADPKSGGKHCGGTQDKHPCTILVIPVHQMQHFLLRAKTSLNERRARGGIVRP